jgi:transglutaminase-like putative cysteine protease
MVQLRLLSKIALIIPPMYLAQSSGFGSITKEIPEGDAGTAATIVEIRHLVYQGVRDVDVNRAAVAIVSGVQAHRPALEARAIYDWVRKNIRFTPDISSAETLRPAREILAIRAGDCDCINGILLPTLFSSVGLESRLVTVAADASRPDLFSHIYPEVLVNGRWTPADAAAEHAAWGKEPGHVYRKRAWSIEDNSYQDLSGCSARVLTGALGQDDDDGDGFNWAGLTQTIAVGAAGAAAVAKSLNTPVYAAPAYSVINGQLVPSTSLTPLASASATVSTSGGLLVTVALVGLVGLLVMRKS